MTTPRLDLSEGLLESHCDDSVPYVYSLTVHNVTHTFEVRTFRQLCWLVRNRQALLEANPLVDAR